MEPTPKVGRIQKGWLLTKSSWRVFKLDKELAALPVISLFVSLIALIPFALIYLQNTNFNFSASSDTSATTTSTMPAWEGALVALGLYFVSTLIANLFGGAIIYGATQRFNGGDPTISGSLEGAFRKFRPLAVFSLMMATVGLALNLLEERVPFAGKIAVWLVSASWSIANVFAVPVIVLSEEDVHPLDATKRSVQIIKKIWGESVVVDLGVSLIGVLAVLGWFGFSALATGGVIALGGAIGSSGTAATVGIAFFVGLFVLGLVALMAIFSALGSIAKAALYHYAVTGQSPVEFDAQLLQTSMTQKKARKIFG